MSFADIVKAGVPASRLDLAPDARLHHVRRRFHPSFNWPQTPREIVFECSDGVCFYANLQLLGIHSPFFADLADVPALHPDEQFHHTVPLPSARSFGFEIFLLAIKHGESYPFPSISREKLLYGILDAIDMADPYDVPMFADLTPHTLLETFKGQPFLQYAMAAALGDEAAAVSASRRTLPLLIEAMPREAADLLLERSPGYYARLQHFHMHVRPYLLSFQQALIINEEIKGTMRFDKACLDTGCTGVKLTRGNFQDLRTAVATTLVRSFAGRAEAWTDRSFIDTVTQLLQCEKCGERIGRAVVGAVAKHERALALKDSI